MGYRRRSRELAMQALFYMDTRHRLSIEMLDLFCLNFSPSANVRPFFQTLVQGVIEKKNDIDHIIEKLSSNWKVSRMACVDRNVIRIAIYEMLCLKDIPSKVSINEAIDIGKKYGTEESGAFINGILDSIRKITESGQIRVTDALEIQFSSADDHCLTENKQALKPL
jgi:transcription antitermination protein NusB